MNQSKSRTQSPDPGLSAAVALLLTALGATAADPKLVSITHPTRGDITRHVALPGSLRANQQVTLQARVAGFVRTVLVEQIGVHSHGARHVTALAGVRVLLVDGLDGCLLCEKELGAADGDLQPDVFQHWTIFGRDFPVPLAEVLPECLPLASEPGVEQVVNMGGD